MTKEPRKVEGRMAIHLNHGRAGHSYIYESTSHPGITICDRHIKKERRVERTIKYKDAEYPTLAEAAAAWESDHG